MSTDDTTTYTVQKMILLLQDGDKDLYDLDFHLKNDDYLGVVAAVLGAVIDDCTTNQKSFSKEHEILLKKIQNDLALLHKTHTITQKKIN